MDMLEEIEQEMRDSAEEKTVGVVNEKGEKITDMVRINDLAIVNTLFTKTDEKTYTFKSRTNKIVIDYKTVRRDGLGKA